MKYQEEHAVRGLSTLSFAPLHLGCERPRCLCVCVSPGPDTTAPAEQSASTPPLQPAGDSGEATPSGSRVPGPACRAPTGPARLPPTARRSVAGRRGRRGRDGTPLPGQAGPAAARAAPQPGHFGAPERASRRREGDMGSSRDSHTRPANGFESPVLLPSL